MHLIKTQRERIHWTDTTRMGGHPFSLKPRPDMLLEGGCTVIRSFKGLGRGGKEESETKFFDVVYDEDYVVNWVKKQVFDSLPGIPYNDFQKLVSKALKLRESEQKTNGK